MRAGNVRGRPARERVPRRVAMGVVLRVGRPGGHTPCAGHRDPKREAFCPARRAFCVALRAGKPDASCSCAPRAVLLHLTLQAPCPALRGLPHEASCSWTRRAGHSASRFVPESPARQAFRSAFRVRQHGAPRPLPDGWGWATRRAANACRSAGKRGTSATLAPWRAAIRGVRVA